MLLGPFIRILLALANIARPAQQLNVIDVIRASARKWFDVINVELRLSGCFGYLLLAGSALSSLTNEQFVYLFWSIGTTRSQFLSAALVMMSYACGSGFIKMLLSIAPSRFPASGFDPLFVLFPILLVSLSDQLSIFLPISLAVSLPLIFVFVVRLALCGSYGPPVILSVFLLSGEKFISPGAIRLPGSTSYFFAVSLPVFFSRTLCGFAFRHLFYSASSHISEHVRGTHERPFSFGTRGTAPSVLVAPFEVFA